MSSKSNTLSAFVEATPPGELSNVTSAIKSITGDSSLSALEPALKKYHEEQLTVVSLPGSSSSALVSSYNQIEEGRYYDTDSSTSFNFDPSTGKASNPRSYTVESKNIELIKSILKSLQTFRTEHYANSTIGVFPAASDARIAIMIAANKYSPSNFWNGRWRATYEVDPESGALEGRIAVDVHYYEDGNVRLLTSRDVSASVAGQGGRSGPEVVKAIAAAERKYQEELNRGFAGLSEGAFKSLRRNLPVSRSKMAWERWEGLRVGQDIGGRNK